MLSVIISKTLTADDIHSRITLGSFGGKCRENRLSHPLWLLAPFSRFEKTFSRERIGLQLRLSFSPLVGHSFIKNLAKSLKEIGDRSDNPNTAADYQPYGSNENILNQIHLAQIHFLARLLDAGPSAARLDPNRSGHSPGP